MEPRTEEMRERMRDVRAERADVYQSAAQAVADRRRGRKRAYWLLLGGQRVPEHDKVEVKLAGLRCIVCRGPLTLSEINEEEMSGTARCKRSCRPTPIVYNWEWPKRGRIHVWSTMHRSEGQPVYVSEEAS